MDEHIDKMEPLINPDYHRDFSSPRIFSTKESFKWWWWMFLFKEDGVRKQIVAFWTTKTYPNLKVNGIDWGPAAEYSGTPDHFSYNGMSTYWYWDGHKFQEILPQVSRFENILQNGTMDIRSDDVHHIHDNDRFFLRFCRDPEDFDLRVDKIQPNSPALGYKRTLITKKMGFDALKIYNSNFSGKLNTKGYERDIQGSLYMQNITLNSPAFPWLWGVYHKDDGSYLTYFTSFMGPLMFSRSSRCKPKWDNRFKFINKNLNYTPKGEETKRFKFISYKVIRDSTGRPGFEVEGSLGDEKIRAVIQTLGKTTYTFERKKYWHNKFFYNEFPSEVVTLEYTDEDGRVHTEDGKDWTGNSEYSWGMLLN